MPGSDATFNVDYWQPVVPEGEPDFEDLLLKISRRKPESNEFKASGDPAIVRTLSKQNGLWVGELGRFRVNDRPGVGNRHGHVRDVPLPDGDEITEDTALVYCPRRKVLALQAGRVKVTETAFANMVSTNLDGEQQIRMEPLVRKDAFERFRSSTGDRKVIFKVRDINSAERLASKAAADGRGTKLVSEIYRSTGASDLDLTFSIGRDPDQGKASNLKSFVADLFKLARSSVGGRVTKLTVFGQDLNGETLVIDLIADRVRTHHSAEKINGRCPYEYRLRSMLEQFDDACKAGGVEKKSTGPS